MGELLQLTPEFIVLAGALAALLVGGARRESALGARLAALAAIAAAAVAVALGEGGALFGGMLDLDRTALVGRVAVVALSAVWLLWVSARGTAPERSSEAASLALVSALGGMLIVSARDLVVLFISLELSTMPAYVLMGYRRDDARGLEGALKYFLLSMLTSLVMLYGLSFVYGIAGTTGYDGLALEGAGALGALAFVFALVGLLAKLSAAPFHYWTPDAYEGAQASSVAFVSTVPKIAGTIALIRLVGVLAPGVGDASLILVAAAVVSMVLGNLAAFPQSDLRRLMAYSGVAHTGYILVALAGGAEGGGAAAYYAIAYAVPSMALMLLAAEEGVSIDDVAGLAARRPALAWAAVVWLLSLVGIPPMVGFFGKLYLFTAAIDAGAVWPVVVAVLMSVVSAGYYFRILRSLFFGERPEAVRVGPSAVASIALGLLALATLGLGVGAAPLLGLLGLTFGR